jgi:hypothetical protein
MPDTAFTSKTIAFRPSERLRRKLEAIAQRDSNPLSATVRRLLRRGLESERREPQPNEAA